MRQNKLYSILFLALSFFIFSSSFAQLTKAEKKQLKKELRQYRKWKPIEIKVLAEDFDEHIANIRQLEREIDSQKLAKDSIGQMFSRQKIDLEDCNTRLATGEGPATPAPSTPATTTEPAVATSDDAPSTPTPVTSTAGPRREPKMATVDKGVVFKVQLGAYEYFNVIKKLSNEEGIIQEVDNGLFKYTLGAYRSVGGAKDLRNEVRKMGISDAWVVSYIDGKRVHIRDAMEAAEAQAALENKQQEEEIKTIASVDNINIGM
ncbi:hypothetical protein JYT59_01505 [Sphingobacteriaceae bacterium AH-315-L07]|nr:hypothetical protein [Sphingobacteriaceae bacterium AH-315-L07]